MIGFKKSLLASLIVLSGASSAFYSSAVSAHGYVSEPASRALNCRGPNQGCGQVQWEPQSVEAAKTATDFPPDGKIASGGWGGASNLDTERANWHRIPMKSGKQHIKWYLTAPHATTNFKYYITKPDWNNAALKPLTRSMFEDKPFCQVDMGGATPPNNVSHECVVPQRSGDHLIYAVWRIDNTAMSFYQIIDVKFDGSNTEEEVIQAPVAAIHQSSNLLTTSGLTLDGSASSGTDVSYQWEVLSNKNKVTLTGANSSKAHIRLNTAASSDFGVDVRLTVSNAKGKDSKTVRLEAKKPAEAVAPVAVAGHDFTVNANSQSRGYDLDGSLSKNAQRYKWTIVSGADIGALQAANGAPWVQSVDAAKARALIKPGKSGKVTYRLTVTAKDGKTHTDDITVTVKAAEQASDIQIVTGGNIDTIVGGSTHSIAVSAKDNALLQGATFRWSALNDADKIQFSSANHFSTNIKAVYPYMSHADITVQVVMTKEGKESKATKIIKIRPKQ